MVAVDSALGGSGRGGGGFFRVAYFKIPRQVDVEISVCILKSCICVKNVLKLNIRALSIIIVEGLGGLIDICSLVYAHCTSYLTPCTECILIVSHKYPLYLMFDNRTIFILSINCAVCLYRIYTCCTSCILTMHHIY